MQAEALQRVALQVAQAHCPEEVIHQIVEELVQEPGVALARIWLLGPGDLCDHCALRPECPDQTRCLHLRASAGLSLAEPDRLWSRIDGRFRRFPLGVRKVGQVAATGESLLLDVADGGWLVDPEWAERESLACFGGQPLVFRGEVLGVLAIFSRELMNPEEFGWLRTFADHAATALANARAFKEVEELREQLELERDYLRDEIKVVKAFGGLVGESPAIRAVLQQVEVVASSDATVLIEGESGTGKELIADAIHERSSRSDRALVRVNCASIPHELFESEFFGHLQGSFTGAARDRAGRFQVADGGTLFLDEVGEIPLELQGKLLRALQEGKFSRVGEDQEREVDVRVVAATNRDLLKEVRAGRFREDLYYRLSVFPIRVPPLRERKDDIPLLARHFVDTRMRDSGATDVRMELRGSDVDTLLAYDWPGNVRELQNVVERALIGARGGRLSLQLPERSVEAEGARTPSESRLLTAAQLKELERENLRSVLGHFHWKISGAGGAAEFLGLHPATLSSRLRAMKLERPRRTQDP